MAANQACNLFGGCVSCPDGSGQTCLETRHRLVGGLPLAAVAIVPRTEADIAVDPACP